MVQHLPSQTSRVDNGAIEPSTVAPRLHQKIITIGSNVTKISNLPSVSTRASIDAELQRKKKASASPPGTPSGRSKSTLGTSQGTRQAHFDERSVKHDAHLHAHELSSSFSFNLPVADELPHRSSSLPVHRVGTPRQGRQKCQHGMKNMKLPPVQCQTSLAQQELCGQELQSIELPGTLPSIPYNCKQGEARFSNPSETIIFLDFDDTVFPTTQVFEEWKLTLDDPNSTRKLEKWAASFKQFMLTVCRLTARCVIVTNSRRKWVETCIDRFAPGLAECLATEDLSYHVVYALELLPQRVARPCRVTNSQSMSLKEEKRDLMTMGKFLAMRNEARRFYSRYDQQTWKNMVSIGDAPYERDALHEVAFKRSTTLDETLRTKTITLKTTLSLSGMLRTFEALQSLLPKWVSHDGDLDIEFTNKKLMRHLSSHDSCQADD